MHVKHFTPGLSELFVFLERKKYFGNSPKHKNSYEKSEKESKIDFLKKKKKKKKKNLFISPNVSWILQQKIYNKIKKQNKNTSPPLFLKKKSEMLYQQQNKRKCM